MAAHIITALAQLSLEVDTALDGGDPVNWKVLDGALALSCWTEDLEFDDYNDLSQIVSAKDQWDLYEWIEDISVRYLAEYARRGFPATREEWRKCTTQASM